MTRVTEERYHERTLHDERLPGGLRTGQQYLDAIAKDGRRIFVDGEEVGDVTAHPAFAETARTMASLFDISSDPARGT